MKNYAILLILSLVILQSCEKKKVGELEFSYINYKSTSNSLYKLLNLNDIKYVELKNVSVDLFKNNLDSYHKIKDSVLFRYLINNTFINRFYERDEFRKRYNDTLIWTYQKHLRWLDLNDNNFFIIGRAQVNKNINSVLIYFNQKDKESHPKSELNNLYILNFDKNNQLKSIALIASYDLTSCITSSEHKIFSKFKANAFVLRLNSEIGSCVGSSTKSNFMIKLAIDDSGNIIRK